MEMLLEGAAVALTAPLPRPSIALLRLGPAVGQPQRCSGGGLFSALLQQQWLRLAPPKPPDPSAALPQSFLPLQALVVVGAMEEEAATAAARHTASTVPSAASRPLMQWWRGQGPQ